MARREKWGVTSDVNKYSLLSSLIYTPREKMSESLIIALLAIVVVYLLIAAKNQRKKSSEVKRRVKDRVWRRDQ